MYEIDRTRAETGTVEKQNQKSVYIHFVLYAQCNRFIERRKKRLCSESMFINCFVFAFIASHIYLYLYIVYSNCIYFSAVAFAFRILLFALFSFCLINIFSFVLRKHLFEKKYFAVRKTDIVHCMCM